MVDSNSGSKMPTPSAAFAQPASGNVADPPYEAKDTSPSSSISATYASNVIIDESTSPSSSSSQPHSTPQKLDHIYLRGLQVTATVGSDAWGRPHKPQPLTLDISLGRSTYAAGMHDDLGQTFSYGIMCKDVLGFMQDRKFDSIDRLTDSLLVMADGWPGESLRIEITARKALLRVNGGLGMLVVAYRECQSDGEDRDWEMQVQEKTKTVHSKWVLIDRKWSLKDFNIPCIIGVNSHERLDRQVVVIDITVHFDGGFTAYYLAERPPPVRAREGMWRDATKDICEVVESSTFQTLEALAALIAKTVLQVEGMREISDRVEVSVEKPSALVQVEGAGVKIVRDWQWFEGLG